MIASPYTRMHMAWRARQSRRRPPRQGPAEGLCRGWRRCRQAEYRRSDARALVHPGVDDAARPTTGVLAPKNSFGAGRRRVRRRAGARDARGHHRGDRRRTSQRARRGGAGRAQAARRIRRGRRLSDHPRPQSRDGLEPADEAATVAGLVIHEARSIPEPRPRPSAYGFRFEVLRRGGDRIAALRITPLAAREERGPERSTKGMRQRMTEASCYGPSLRRTATVVRPLAVRQIYLYKRPMHQTTANKRFGCPGVIRERRSRRPTAGRGPWGQGRLAAAAGRTRGDHPARTGRPFQIKLPADKGKGSGRERAGRPRDALRCLAALLLCSPGERSTRPASEVGINLVFGRYTCPQA